MSLKRVFALGRRASSSHSTIKHLITGTSTTSSLYDDHGPSSAAPEHKSLNKSLLDLVSTAKIGAADRLRIQMIDRRIPIEPHLIYEKAAISCPHSKDIDRSVEHFTAWFSLVPDNSNTKGGPSHHHRQLNEPFKAIRIALLASGIPSSRLPLIMRFGLLCVSKGYTQPMISEIIPLVTRFAGEDAGVDWLRDVEQLAISYQTRGGAGAWDIQETSRWARTLSVEVSIQARWLRSAVAIVELPRSYSLPTRMYKLLVQELSKTPGMQEELEKVKKLVERDVMLPRGLERMHTHLGRFAPSEFQASGKLKEESKKSAFESSD